MRSVELKATQPVTEMRTVAASRSLCVSSANMHKDRACLGWPHTSVLTPLLQIQEQKNPK